MVHENVELPTVNEVLEMLDCWVASASAVLTVSNAEIASSFQTEE